MAYDYVQLITNLGFPIFVALYFMFRFEKILRANTEAIDNLREIVKFLHEKLK